MILFQLKNENLVEDLFNQMIVFMILKLKINLKFIIQLSFKKMRKKRIPILLNLVVKSFLLAIAPHLPSIKNIRYIDHYIEENDYGIILMLTFSGILFYILTEYSKFNHRPFLFISIFISSLPDWSPAFCPSC